MRATPAGVLLTLALLSIPAVEAAPAPGESFPVFEARDVCGVRTRFHALLDGRPTFVVAITDRKAQHAMRRWFEAATEALGEYNLVSIVSVDMGGWFSSKTVRGWARKRVPEPWQSRTLFDSNQRMQKLLALEGEQPWVFVLDAEGRVLARVQGPWSPTRAQMMFEAYATASR